jgi:hypothetical protein
MHAEVMIHVLTGKPQEMPVVVSDGAVDVDRDDRPDRAVAFRAEHFVTTSIVEFISRP